MKPDLPQLEMESIEEIYGQSPEISSGRVLGRSARRVIRTVLVIGSVLIAWEVLARLNLVSQVFFPPPSAICQGLIDILHTGFYGSTLLENLFASVGRVAVGF